MSSMLATGDRHCRCAPLRAMFDAGERAKNPGYQFAAQGWAESWVSHTPTALQEEDLPVSFSRVLPTSRYTRRSPVSKKNLPVGGCISRTGSPNTAGNFNLIEDPKTTSTMCGLRGMERHRRAMTAAATAKGWIGACSVPAQAG